MSHTGRYRDEPDHGPEEPDYEQMAEDRAEANFDPDAAEARYENFVYGN